MTADRAPGDAAPSPLAGEVLKVWRDVLGNERLGLDDDFFAAGGDSLQAVQVLAALEHVMGAHVSSGALMAGGTARRVAALIERSRHAEPCFPPGLVLVRQGAPGRNLFCLPGLGGLALQVRPLAVRLHTNRSVLAVEVHNLGVPEATFDSLNATAAVVVETIRRAQPAGPYALLGYSYGGNLAVEVAGHLLRDGHQVEMTIVLGAFAPGALRLATGWPKIAAHLRILGRLTTREAADYIVRRLLRKLRLGSGELDERTYMEDDRRQIRHWHLAPAAQSETARRVEVLLDKGHRAIERHRPAPFPGRVVLLHPRELPDWYELTDPSGTCGWGPLCTGGVEVIDLAGGHYGLFEEPRVDALAETINGLIARVDDAASR